jgi:SAM-dependent methyltransferase
VAEEYAADLVLDIGTGYGSSALAFAAARPVARVVSFDLYNNVSSTVVEELKPSVQFRIGDLCQTDFAPIVGDARSVVVFWDAHGFEVAAHMLGHLMPLIAERKHIVLCHDMPHIALQADLAYGGKPSWRGMEHHYASNYRTAHVILGWTVTIVDQIIPILDFCARNRIEFRSADQDIHVDNVQRRAELQAALGIRDNPTYNVGYFSMNDTTSRHFPPKT